MNPSQNEPEAIGPIDAVITWVDGSDPAHIAKREAALRRDRGWSLTAIPAGRAPTRFADNGELRYCIAGIRKFLPWIRTIHLVTDEQRPAFLDEETCRHLKVNIVDHTAIFRGYEWALPTFNSQTIETMVHRITGLAERFVYFNDDVLVLKDAPPDAFFQGEHIAVRGEWMPLEKFGLIRLATSGIANHVFERIFGRPRPMHILPQMRAATMAKLSRCFLRNHHVPIAVRRSTLVRYFHEHPRHLEQNIRFRFRDMRQFNTMPLAIHLEIASGKHLVINENEHETIGFGSRDRTLVETKLERILHGQPRFVCVQSLDMASESDRRKLLAHFDQLLHLANGRSLTKTYWSDLAARGTEQHVNP